MTSEPKKETKKAAKARMIAEKIAAADAAKARYRAEIFAHPVAIAIEPLRLAAVKQAEKDALAYVATIEEALKKHGYDINALAPRPRTNMGKEEWRRADSKRSSVQMLTKEVNKDPFRRWNDESPLIVETCPERIAHYVKITKDMAEMQYEGFVYKLVRKLKEHTTAEVSTATLNNEAMENDTIWHLSLLTVTRADGSVEKWRTRMIFNTSIYGKVFPQWPTRIVK